MSLTQHTSVRNAYLARRGRSCACRPYYEILAVGRWSKEGLAPKRNARPTLIRVWLPFTRVDSAGSRTERAKRMVTAKLFCRCQMEQSRQPARRRTR